MYIVAHENVFEYVYEFVSAQKRTYPSSTTAFQPAAQMLCAGYSVPTALHIPHHNVGWMCMFCVTVISILEMFLLATPTERPTHAGGYAGEDN